MNIKAPDNEPPAQNIAFICYICQRKFPTEEKLKIHESMSELHKQNLEKQKLSEK